MGEHIARMKNKRKQILITVKRYKFFTVQDKGGPSIHALAYPDLPGALL
jgi:hypothetical protein